MPQLLREGSVVSYIFDLGDGAFIYGSDKDYKLRLTGKGSAWLWLGQTRGIMNPSSETAMAEQNIGKVLAYSYSSLRCLS